MEAGFIHTDEDSIMKPTKQFEKGQKRVGGSGI
jgi:hypothetical protein